MEPVRLLIAYNNPHILRFLSDLLSDDRCIVGTVSDENALFAAVVALHPHIIITNIDMMPATAGLDTVHQVKTLIPDSKVFSITAG
jgi:CheY-like chemotaxis protein